MHQPTRKTILGLIQAANNERGIARALFHTVNMAEWRLPTMRRRDMMGDAIAARKHARYLDFEAHRLIWKMR